LHAYLNDLFMYSNSVDEHEKHLALIFEKIRKFQFYLKEEKCELYTEQVDCLSHMIDHRGLHADAYNDVQKFVGLIQYLAHFLPDLLSYTGPLSAMSKNGQLFAWRLLHDKCFEMIKYICCKTPVLVPVNHDKDDPIWVICDASVSGVGTMYSQGPMWQTCRPAGFMSCKFMDAQRHYCVFEQETITILEVLLKWEDKLIGYCIHVVTNH
jgi:hypothetical protein